MNAILVLCYGIVWVLAQAYILRQILKCDQEPPVPYGPCANTSHREGTPEQPNFYKGK